MSSVAVGGSCRTKSEVHQADTPALAHLSIFGDQAKLKGVTISRWSNTLRSSIALLAKHSSSSDLMMVNT
jgi:hypothetical protein